MDRGTWSVYCEPPHLLCWRPRAATFGMTSDRINIVAINTVFVFHVGETERRSVGRTALGLHVPSPLRLHVRKM